MANKEWESATTEQKLEMLRADIKEISDFHNALGRDYRSQIPQLWAAIQELKDSRPKIEDK